MHATISVNPIALSTFGCNFGNMESKFSANNIYFMIDGKPFVPIAGEFHFSRYDCRLWKRELLKMKASGLNAVATYLFWNHHEYNRGEFDFSGDRDIGGFLRCCKETGMRCVLRIGPWAHGECKWGGFPPFVQAMRGKRSDDTTYLQAVEAYWRALICEVLEYLDGDTVFAIQLENEFTGDISHICTLRKLAEKIGFTAPFFTMTAWGVSAYEASVLPTCGAYADAPWAGVKRKLEPQGRFDICSGRLTSEIGSDLVVQRAEKKTLLTYPFAGCEVGTGNEVTNLRRPIINTLDGYGIAFAKFAAGMNWMGYYMYHGGRNPIGIPLQESRLSLYPNDYPIIDYDFQAPFGKNGEKNSHCDHLRLMHTFISHWDDEIALKQAFFGDIKLKNGHDNTIPYYSVRCDDNLSGYMFIGNYEKGRDNADIPNFEVQLQGKDKSLTLPAIDIPKDALFFYPFNFTVGDVTVDYVMAQPIAKDGKRWYFKRVDGIAPAISIGGKVVPINGEYKLNTSDGAYVFVLLDAPTALNLYYFDKVYISKDTLYECDGKIYAERTTKLDKHSVTLSPCKKSKLPYNYYLYSHGKRRYYSLSFGENITDGYEDLQLQFEFSGLNLQVFWEGQLIDDYFNTNGIYTLRIGSYLELLKMHGELIIKTVPPTRFGVGNVYSEMGLQAGQNSLELRSVSSVCQVALDDN